MLWSVKKGVYHTGIDIYIIVLYIYVCLDRYIYIYIRMSRPIIDGYLNVNNYVYIEACKISICHTSIPLNSRLCKIKGVLTHSPGFLKMTWSAPPGSIIHQPENVGCWAPVGRGCPRAQEAIWRTLWLSSLGAEKMQHFHFQFTNRKSIDSFFKWNQHFP